MRRSRDCPPTAAEAPTSKPTAQLMIERAVGALLPHAASNFMMPFHTPLRWHESYMQGESQPLSFALWVCLDPDRQRTIDINRTFPADRNAPDGLWSCHVKELTPPAEDEAERAKYEAAGLVYPEGLAHRTVSVSVSKYGEVAVDVARYKKVGPAQHDTCTGVEINTALSSDRRGALLGYIGEMLTVAAVQSPQDQRDFFAKEGLDLASRTFERLASPASREALAPVLAAHPASK